MQNQVVRVPGRWAIGCVSVLLAGLLLAGCGDNEPAPTPVTVTVETGGMAVGTAATAEATPPVATVAPTVEPVLGEGAAVAALATLRLYAEPDTASLPLAEYAGGATLRVVAPGEDYGAYPVEAAGLRWYRVRAEDGLVGWARGDQVGNVE